MWRQGLLTTLQSPGFYNNILRLRGDHLRGNVPRLVFNGAVLESHLTGVGVPQDSVLGPLLWNGRGNDLNLIPEPHVPTDDVP